MGWGGIVQFFWREPTGIGMVRSWRFEGVEHTILRRDEEEPSL